MSSAKWQRHSTFLSNTWRTRIDAERVPSAFEPTCGANPAHTRRGGRLVIGAQPKIGCLHRADGPTRHSGSAKDDSRSRASICWSAHPRQEETNGTCYVQYDVISLFTQMFSEGADYG